MPSANVENLVNIATNLVKKRLAMRESAPTVFETLQNIDDQIRLAVNAVQASGEYNDLTTEQKFLVNNAVNTSRSALMSLEGSYTPDKDDIVGELRDIQKVDFRQLDKVQESDKELYEKLVKLGIIIDTGKGDLKAE
jgi:rhamnose utilization protein RhaD (predicted bifunctional aldolase and dehydrogenase)